MAAEIAYLRDLLGLLREHGVTEYRDGDLSLSVRPAPAVVAAEAQAAPAAPVSDLDFLISRQAPRAGQ